MAKRPSIYVAGPSSDLERCERVIARLRALGWTIAEDWPARLREERARCGATSDREVPREVLAEAWRRNARGIRLAEAVLVLADGVSHGRAAEVGCIAGVDCDDDLGTYSYWHVAVSGDWRTLGLVGALIPGSQCYEDDDAAIEALERWAALVTRVNEGLDALIEDARKEGRGA